MPTQEENDKALLDAASNGSVEEVRGFLLAGANLDASDQYGDTALHLAAGNGHAAVVTALLEKWADLEAKDQFGDTALIIAADKGHAAVVTALVQAGAYLGAKNIFGDTALHIAAGNGHAAVVTALVQAGADADATSNDGRTALHWARYHTGIVFEIEEYIKSGEYEWKQHLPRLRQAAWNYYNPDKTSITVGIANKVIPCFLHSISLPQKRLAFAKLLHMRLSAKYRVGTPCIDILNTIGEKLAAQPKIINVKITEIFAKKMAEPAAEPEPEARTSHQNFQPQQHYLYHQCEKCS